MPDDPRWGAEDPILDPRDPVEGAIIRKRRADKVHDAYKVISAALNTGDEALVGEAIAREHSTLLGKLANTVLAEVAKRPHDGRLESLNRTVGSLADIDPERRLAEWRQPLI